MGETVDENLPIDELNLGITLETILSNAAFEETLQTAIEVCLPGRDVFDTRLEEVRQARALEEGDLPTFCLWGIRRQIEISIGARYVDDAAEAEDNRDSIDTLANKNVQDKIEAFGLALIDESFSVLGKDAPAKVLEYKAAKTREEQYKVIVWLVERIEAIDDIVDDQKKTDDIEALDQVSVVDAMDTYSADLEAFSSIEEPALEEPEEEPDTDDETAFYHPVRLSPKILGQYPDVKLKPTCLSKSILIASFFEKCGVEYLHAGLARSSVEDARYAHKVSMSLFMEDAKDKNSNVSDEVNERLKDTRADLIKKLNHNMGYHATILVNVVDGWLCIDPNYFLHYMVGPSTSFRFHKALNILKDIAPETKGVDIMLDDPNSAITMRLAYEFSHMIDNPKDTFESISKKLANLSTDVSHEELVELFFPFLFDDEEKYKATILDLLDFTYRRETGRNSEERLMYLVKKTLEDYAFPDSEYFDFSKSIKRCQSDPSYALNRTHDLLLAPNYLMLKIISNVSNMIVKGTFSNYPVPVFEVGLPNFRIGACVLSDFEVYCGAGINTSFWLDNWASTVGSTEHMADWEENSIYQTTYQGAVLDFLRESGLRYFKNDEIIFKFLEHGKESDKVGD
jgi:hypothetical protein